jgi:hypothetical protein
MPASVPEEATGSAAMRSLAPMCGRCRGYQSTLTCMSQEVPGPALDPERHRPENSWTVGTSAMTQQEAERAVSLIEGHFPEVYAQAVDPNYWLTWQLDRWSAGLLQEGLRRVAAAGGDVGALLEDVDDFLARADPDADSWPGLG